jgi:hypothetical protein
LSANILGRSYLFASLTAILPGREQELRDYLELLPPAAESPLARVAGVHFGRWVIVSSLVYFGPPAERDDLKNAYLLFAAAADGPLERFLDALCDGMPEEADAIWGYCVGYPGSENRDAFHRYLRHNQIDTQLPFAAYPEATLPEVLEALELRVRLIDLAVRAQELDALSLQQAYREAFDG